jgi:hypothetical protein
VSFGLTVAHSNQLKFGGKPETEIMEISRHWLEKFVISHKMNIFFGVFLSIRPTVQCLTIVAAAQVGYNPPKVKFI